MARERMEAIVVGAGLMGGWHAHAIVGTGGVIAGVVDSDSARAAALAARYRGARSFTQLEMALGTVSPDIVHICTPLESHGSLVRAALRAGCHVLAEKPLAQTADETRDLLAEAQGAGRLLVPVHQFPFQRGALALIGRLASLGPVIHLEVGTASAGAAGASPAGADAVAAEILPHFLALTRRILGVQLAVQPWSVTRPRAGEWRVTARCGAVSVSYVVSMSARPTFAELRVLGEHSSARLDLFHGFAVFESGAVSRSAKMMRPFKVAGRSLVTASSNLARRALSGEPAYPGLKELVRRVYAAARGDGENPIPFEETLDIAVARDRLIAFGAEGNRC